MRWKPPFKREWAIMVPWQKSPLFYHWLPRPRQWRKLSLTLTRLSSRHQPKVGEGRRKRFMLVYWPAKHGLLGKVSGSSVPTLKFFIFRRKEAKGRQALCFPLLELYKAFSSHNMFLKGGYESQVTVKKRPFLWVVSHDSNGVNQYWPFLQCMCIDQQNTDC
jgi:hypothetical protein